MSGLYAYGALLLVLVLVLWAGFRAARVSGRDEQRAEEAEHVVQNAERITAAVEAAPRDAADLVKRVSERGRI